MKLKKVIMYLLEWLIPSSTAVYIILATKFDWGTYFFWGYPMNMPAYVIACITGALLYYNVNKYIFKTSCDPIEITVNGISLEVLKGDVIKADPEYGLLEHHGKNIIEIIKR